MMKFLSHLHFSGQIPKTSWLKSWHRNICLPAVQQHFDTSCLSISHKTKTNAEFILVNVTPALNCVRLVIIALMKITNKPSHHN